MEKRYTNDARGRETATFGDHCTKEVIAVYFAGKFQQFLMKSEVRLLLDILRDNRSAKIELIKISDNDYKIAFGK